MIKEKQKAWQTSQEKIEKKIRIFPLIGTRQGCSLLLSHSIMPANPDYSIKIKEINKGNTNSYLKKSNCLYLE